MFCSLRISTDKRVARSLCHSRATCLEVTVLLCLTFTVQFVDDFDDLQLMSQVVFPTTVRQITTTTTILWPFILDYPHRPVPKKTFTHSPSCSSSNLCHLPPSTPIDSILPVQIACLANFCHNLSPRPLWSTSWSGAIHLIFHTFFHAIIVFFSRHMPIPSQPVLL